jgi:hypothetical protein
MACRAAIEARQGWRACGGEFMLHANVGIDGQIAEGGKQILDILSRNEAIDLWNLQS